MGLLNFLGILSPAHIMVFNWLNARAHVGTDSLGNRYFRGNPRKGYQRERRWVMYNGEAEATRVPPEWHGWLHYQTDVIPADDTGFRRPWQKPHQPNRTGTNAAYRPPGHVLEGGQRQKATGDYEAWTPKT
jgi:NADH:ubiquinone oxidoreductase subunit